MEYDIYGIGGALVDIEFLVSDKFLLDAKIEKSVMTLVNESRQRKLIEMLESESCKIEKKCGGSVCNSLVAASNFGARTFFSGKVADDNDGEIYINDLVRAGVDFHSAGQKQGTTGKCLVMVTKDAERTMNTFLGVSDLLSIKEIDKNALKNSEWLYLEGYLFTNEERTEMVKEVIKFARSHKVKIAISLSDPFIVKTFRQSLLDVIGNGIDLVFCNKDEALSFAESKNLLDCAVNRLKKFAKTFVITDGPDGAIIFDGDSVFLSQGYKTKAIDTNGAGDMFAGAFLYAITSGRSYHWASKFANNCAAKVVAKFGPRLDPEDFSAIREKFNI